MKRPVNLDPPRRKRALSGEELALWESVANEARPLRKKPRVAKISPAPVEAEHAAAQPVLKTTKTSAPPKTPAARPPAQPLAPLAPLGRREKSHLARGRKDIDARLDLHGMTQTRAHRALKNFLHDASESGMSFVLVITGKGKVGGAESERGVLRRQVPEWLSLPEFRGMVIGFEEASIGHGGAGALYVRVRRAR